MLIAHGCLVTLDRESRVIHDGALRIEGARIVAVGSSTDLCSQYAEDALLDAEDMLVLPGLVSAHTHLHQVMGRGLPYLAAEVPARWRRYAKALTYDDIRYSTLLGCIEAIRSGTTTLFDQHTSLSALDYSLDAIAEAVKQAGLRACLSYAVTEADGLGAARDAVQENLRFARRVVGDSMLAAAMGLESSASLGDNSLAAAVSAAAVGGMGFHVNVARDVHDLRDTQARYGLRVVDRLRKFGVLGPRTLAVYCTRLLSAEMDTLKRTGTWVAHAPRASALHELEAADAAQLLRHGIPVCLGTDDLAPDLFDEIQAAYLLHRHHPGDPRAIRAEDLLEMALVHGAGLASRAFGQPIGRIEVGAVADIILVRAPFAALLTPNELATRLVLGMGHAHVDTTIVAGQVLMRHGVIRSMDERAVVEAAAGYARDLRDRLA